MCTAVHSPFDIPRSLLEITIKVVAMYLNLNGNFVIVVVKDSGFQLSAVKPTNVITADQSQQTQTTQ